MPREKKLFCSTSGVSKFDSRSVELIFDMFEFCRVELILPLQFNFTLKFTVQPTFT